MATLHEYARSMSTVRHVLEKDPAAADRVHVVTSFEDADFVLRSKEFTVLTAEDGYSRDVSDPILRRYPLARRRPCSLRAAQDRGCAVPVANDAGE